jgi:hypothetical protein
VLGSLVMRVVNWGIGLLGGGIYLAMSRGRPPSEESREREQPKEPAALAPVEESLP